MSYARRINPIQRSLSRPLTILGAERKLFFFAMRLGAATFNLLNSLSGGVLMFIYEGSAAFTDFVRDLEAYLPLFRQLSEFRLVYAARTDSQFEKATEIFHSPVKIPLESDISDDLLRYFRVREVWDERQYAAVTDADLVFRNHARALFTGEGFEGLYRDWKNDRISESCIRQQVGTNDRKHAIGFETYLLQQTASAEAGNPVKKARITLCTFSIATSSPERDPKSFESRALRNRGKPKSPWKKVQIGRERPHFFGLQPPKSFWGRSRPAAQQSCRSFFHGDEKFG